MNVESLLMWSAVTLYAAGSVLYVIGLVFHERLLRVALWVSILGLVPHVAAIAVRSLRVGHLPFLGFYEVVSASTVVTVATFAIVAWRWSPMHPMGVVVMPVAFIALGGAMMASKADLAITPTLASWWLTLHVGFAKLSYSSLMLSFALAVVYLLRERVSGGRMGPVLDKLPPQETIDSLSYKFVAAGFLFLGVMIAAGAVWANEAWGRYWAWDPIETWSLLSWITYAGYLHLRLTMGWRGRRSAWYAVFALPVMVFALIGVPIVYRSIHATYIRGY